MSRSSLRMKGIEWVALDPRIARDERIVAIAAALGRDRYWVAGHFPQFLGEVAEQRPSGDLSGLPEGVLDAWAGDVEGWGKLIREHLCDERGVLRAWWKLNGRALEKLEKDRARKRGDGRGRPPADGTDDSGAEVPRNRRGGSTEDGAEVPPTAARKRRGTSVLTDTDTETDSTTSAQRGGARASESPLVLALLADVEQAAPEFLPDFRAVLITNPGADSLVRSLRALENGMNGPGGRAVPLPVLGQALREQRGNGQSLSMQGIAIYAERLMRPRSVVSPTEERPSARPRAARAATYIPDLTEG